MDTAVAARGGKDRAQGEAMIVLQATVAEKIMVCAAALLFTLFTAMFNSFVGTKNPILNWTSEIIPIKQSSTMLIALFGGWGFVALFAVPYFFIGNAIGLVPYLTIWSAIYLIASLLLYRWLNTKGARIFAEL